MNFLIADLILLVLFGYWLLGALHARFEEDDAPRADDRFSYEAWHEYGSNPCGQLAFTFIDDPRGRSMRSADIVMPDGKHPKYCAVIVCGGCGCTPRGEPGFTQWSQLFELRKINKIGE